MCTYSAWTRRRRTAASAPRARARRRSRCTGRPTRSSRRPCPDLAGPSASPLPPCPGSPRSRMHVPLHVPPGRGARGIAARCTDRFPRIPIDHRSWTIRRRRRHCRRSRCDASSPGPRARVSEPATSRLDAAACGDRASAETTRRRAASVGHEISTSPDSLWADLPHSRRSCNLSLETCGGPSGTLGQGLRQWREAPSPSAI